MNAIKQYGAKNPAIRASLEKRWEFLRKTIPARFWSRVDVGTPRRCWPWKSRVTPNGYGHFVCDGDFVSAHRKAYELTFGQIPEGMYICHFCDNKKCCNPSHLFCGTAKDNAMDASQKGLLPRLAGSRNGMFGKVGELHPNRKLTDDTIRKIRQKYSTGAFKQSTLAEEFKLTQGHVSAIVRRAIWDHVD